MPPPRHLLKSIHFTGCQCSVLVFKLPSHWIRYDKSLNFIGYKKSLRGRIAARNIKARLQTICCFFQQQRGKIHSLSRNVIRGSFHKALITQFMNLALGFFAFFSPLYIPLVWACPRFEKCPALNMSAQEQTQSRCSVQGCLGKLPDVSKHTVSQKFKEMSSEFWGSFTIHCFLLTKPQLPRKLWLLQ